MTEYEVGDAVGRIWHALTRGGVLTTAQLIKALRLSADEVEQGVGWLVRQRMVECSPGSCGATLNVTGGSHDCTSCLDEDG